MLTAENPPKSETGSAETYEMVASEDCSSPFPVPASPSTSNTIMTTVVAAITDIVVVASFERRAAWLLAKTKM